MEETSIGEIFARDPLALSEQDIDRLITQLRQQRQKYVAGNMTADKPEAKKSVAQKKGEALAKQVGDIDLSDLGL